MKKFCLLFAATCLALFAHAQVKTTQSNGLSTVQLDSDAGAYQVQLPRLSQGAAISGTVAAQPLGKNDRQTAKNGAYLNGLVVEFDSAGQKTRPGDILKFVVPPAATIIWGSIKDPSGKTISRFSVPAYPAEPAPPGNFAIPSVAQAGEPLFIPGPADGDLTNTIIRFNGLPFTPVAEATDGIYVQPAPGLTGPVLIELTDSGVGAAGTTNLIGIALSAGHLSLKPGQITDLQVTVTGLEGVQEPVTILLQNESPAIVAMGGGNQQTIVVEPGQPVHHFNTKLVGQQTGTFGVSADVMAPAPLVSDQPGSCATEPKEKTYLIPVDGVKGEDEAKLGAKSLADDDFAAACKFPCVFQSDVIEIKKVYAVTIRYQCIDKK